MFGKSIIEYRTRLVGLCLLALTAGCVGGIPSIPKTPDATLKKGRDYFEKHKYYQAQALFKAFLADYPGHDQSDEAQFYVAECHFYDKEYPLAAVEYRILMSNYGYSEYVDDALFKIAVCSFKEAPRANLDQTKSFEALSLFEQFLRTFPKSPFVEKANEYVNEIYKKLAKKDFENGYFYYHQKRYESASIYFEKVIDKYPGSKNWMKALYYQAKILAAQGDKKGAEELLKRALEYPSDIEIKRKAKADLRLLGVK